MGIKKLLSVATFLVAGSLAHTAWAQTDVTSTYLTNADFEGSYTSVYTINNDGRYVYQPEGWTADYVNKSTWNMSVVKSTDAMASNFTGDYAVPADNNRYMVRFRDNQPTEYIDLYQTITIQEAGIYTFSADLIREDGSKVDVQLYAGNTSVSNANPGVWENRSLTVTLSKDEVVKVGVKFINKAASGNKVGADNVKISFKSFDEVTEDAPIDFTSMANNTVAGWTFNGSNRDRKITNFDGQDMVQCYSDNYYTGDAMTQIISGLPTGIYNVEVYCQAQLANWNNHALVAEDGATDITFLKVNDQSRGIPVYQDKNARTKTLYTLNDVKVTDGNITVKVTNEKEGANWILANIKTIKYLGADLSLLEESWTTNVASAQAALADETYNIVTGEERTTLVAKAAATPVETVKGYNEAIGELTTALNAFKAAKTSYEALVSAKESASVYTTETYPYASEAKKTVLDNAVAAVATSAADADAKVAAIVTAYRLFVESNGMAEGIDGAVDYTSSIKGTDASVSTEGWSGIGTNQGQSYTDGNGAITTKYFDGGWSQNAGANINLTQNVTLPSGKYLIQITARGATALDVYSLSVGNVSVNLPIEGSAEEVGTFGRGWSDRFLEFESDGTEQTITIKATSTATQQWISFNRIRLTQLEMYAEKATAEDYASLNNAIAAAEAKTLGFEAGEYAPYNNVATLKALATAKAVDQNAVNAKEDIENLISALAIWTANETDVDAIYNGHFATVTEGANYPDGWARTNAWGQMRTDAADSDNGTAYYNQPGSLVYGGTGVYAMPLAAETYYRLTFKYRSHENGSNNGVTVNVLNGEDGLSGKVFGANASTSVWAVGEVCFQTGAAGNYTLTLANNGNTWMTDVTLVKCVEATATMTITDVKYGTFIAPFDVEIPTGVTATKITGVDANGVTLVEEAVEGTIPANTPVLLYSETVVNETFTAQSVATDTVYSEGLLTGNLSGHYIYAPMDSYILLDGVNGIGFYRVVSDDVTVSNNRVYLTVPAGAEAKAFISFGDATSINGVTDGATEVVRYNAAGVKVNAPVKGLNIVKMSDGTVKKVMVK